MGFHLDLHQTALGCCEKWSSMHVFCELIEQRCVPQDDLLGPIYPASDLPGAEQRLRDFLIGRFGGPQTYIEQRGHPRLRARHSPFAINQTIRDRWMRLMENAFWEASLPSKGEEVLRKFFNEMSTSMINQSESGIK